MSNVSHLKFDRTTFTILLITVIVASVLLGIGLSTLIWHNQTPESKLSATLDFYPILVKVAWNTSTITQYNQWIQVNQTATNIGSSPANVAPAYLWQMSLIAPNGTDIDHDIGGAPSFTKGTPLTVPLNKSQVITVIYNINFPNKSSPANASFSALKATIYWRETGLDAGLYTLNDFIFFPSGIGTNQYQIISIPIDVET